MNRYMPITGHDCTIPSLLIDTQAPADVLYEAAAYRIRAVTQLLENFAARPDIPGDAVVLQELALICAIPLRHPAARWLRCAGCAGSPAASAAALNL